MNQAAWLHGRRMQKFSDVLSRETKTGELNRIEPFIYEKNQNPAICDSGARAPNAVLQNV